jgi:hypothetical protein
VFDKGQALFDAFISFERKRGISSAAMTGSTLSRDNILCIHLTKSYMADAN